MNILVSFLSKGVLSMLFFGSLTILCHFLQRAPQIPSMALGAPGRAGEVTAGESFGGLAAPLPTLLPLLHIIYTRKVFYFYLSFKTHAHVLNSHQRALISGVGAICRSFREIQIGLTKYCFTVLINNTQTK